MDGRALGGLALATLGLWIGCGLDSAGTGVFNGAGGGPTTSSTTSTGMGGQGPGGTGGSGGAGGEGGIGGQGGTGGALPLPISCTGLPDGIHTIDPDGDGVEVPLDTYCSMDWALIYNSVKFEGGGGAGGSGGTTTEFWNIPFADRFKVKGEPMLTANFYAGALYRQGKLYRDELEDTSGGVADAAVVSVDGFDETSMAFTMPVLTSGLNSIFIAHFQFGWSTSDADHDSDPSQNCAVTYFNVSQHYAGCWEYNLGASSDGFTNPIDDGGWGPHATSATLVALSLAVNEPPGTVNFSRLNRISRWAKWP